MGHLFIPGTPVPQGSAKGYLIRSKRNPKPHVAVTHDNPKTVPWRDTVAANMRTHLGPRIPHPRPEAIRLDAYFIMPRRAHEPAYTPCHTRKPDRDKLLRAVQDALSGLLYEDDAQVVAGETVKRTAAVGEQPGVLLQWCRVDQIDLAPGYDVVITTTDDSPDRNGVVPDVAHLSSDTLHWMP